MVASPSIEVIMPTRDMREMTIACAERVVGQLAHGDRFSIFDDASTDGTAAALHELGVHVVRSSRPLGPYAGRHLLASRSRADILVFLDARSRPMTGWLEAHRRLFDDAAVALSCTGTRVSAGPGLGARIFRASNMFEISTKLDVPYRLAFFPTANLGVRRSAYEGVGGFREMRSGGDADLCWRIQLDGLGAFAADRRVLMEWVPRATLRDVVNQWTRYGRSSAYLETVYGNMPSSGSRATTRRSVGSALLQSTRQMRRTPFASTAQLALDAVNMAVYYRAKSSSASAPVPMPVPYELAAYQNEVHELGDV